MSSGEKSRKRAKQGQLTDFFNKVPRIDDIVELIEPQPIKEVIVENLAHGENNQNQCNSDVASASESENKKSTQQHSVERKFVPEWYAMYGAKDLKSNTKNKVQCVICGCNFTSIRGSSLKSHYELKHKKALESTAGNSNEKIPSYDKDNTIAIAKRVKEFDEMQKNSDKRLEQQQNAMKEIFTHESSIKLANLNLALECGKNNWSFNSGPRVSCDFQFHFKFKIKFCVLCYQLKNTVSSTMEKLLSSPEFSPELKTLILTKIDKMKASRNTIQRNIEKISDFLNDELIEILMKCRQFGLCIDESTDVNDIAQLTIFVRIVNEDFTVIERYFKLKSLYGRTTAADIFEGVASLQILEIVGTANLGSLTTDAAATMVGSVNGFTTRMKLYVKNENRIPLISLPCVIHQVALCTKVDKTGETSELFNVAWKITKTIKNKSATIHRHFREFVTELNVGEEKGFCDLLNHNNVRWLSRGIFEKKF